MFSMGSVWPATTKVDYGPSTNYGSTVNNAALSPSHSIMLPGLVCSAPYNFKVTSVDGGGNPTSSTNQTFVTSSCLVVGPPYSDDFHANALDTSLWSFVNPVGDASISVNGTQALITIPPGATHDAWSGGNTAAHIMQPIANNSFEVEAKFAPQDIAFQ